jgi:HlyD family secretion protein
MIKFFTKKRIIWGVIILLVVGPIVYKIVKGKDTSKNIVTETVRKQNIRQTVLSTGQVVSGTDLSLSFKASGVVERVNVKEGEKAQKGQILGSLSQRDQLASLTSARGTLAQAQANYNKVLAGSSNEDVAVSQVALDNAKSVLENTEKQQQVLVDNAYKALLNSGLSAIAGNGNTASVTATISGTYTDTKQGVYKVSIYSTGAGLRFKLDGLETSDGPADVTPQPMGTKGLYIQFSDKYVPSNNTWTVSIPNTQASTYVTNYNAYQAALETQRTSIAAAKNSVSSAQAALDLKKAQARPADVQAAQAQILSASGQVLAAEASLENTVVRAPADGTITKVDVKVGEQSTALKEVFVLQDVDNLHAESFVSEANIASLKPGQAVDYTFDTLGADRHFKGTIEFVNPSSVVNQGVVNFKVIATMEKVPEIKPGMTANMTVLISEKENVLAIPLRAIISNGSKKVRVIDNSEKKTYHEVEVTTGLEADGGVIEVLSGLNDGQEIVTFIKK